MFSFVEIYLEEVQTVNESKQKYTNNNNDKKTIIIPTFTRQKKNNKNQFVTIK